MSKRLLSLVLIVVLCIGLLPTVALAGGSDHDPNGYDSTDGYFDWKDTVVEVDSSTGKLAKITSNAWYNYGRDALTGRPYGFLLIEKGLDTVKQIPSENPWDPNGINVRYSSTEVQTLLNNGVDLDEGTLSSYFHQWIKCTIPADRLTSCSLNKDYNIYIYTRTPESDWISFESCMGTLTKVTVNQYTFTEEDQTGKKVATVSSMGVLGVAYNPTGVKYKGLSYDATRTGTLQPVSAENKTFDIYYKLSDIPTTGDNNTPLLFAGLLLLTGVGLVALKKRSAR